jgi:hypothetical protein
VTTEPRPLVLPSGTAMRLAFIEDPVGFESSWCSGKTCNSAFCESP